MISNSGILPAVNSSIDNLVRRVRRLETLEDKVGGAGGWPILTVAASDASAQAKADADYICDGTADQVEIQAALDANHAEAGEQDSTVYLTEGHFYLSAAIKMYSYSTLWGSGMKTILLPHANYRNTSFNYVENSKEHVPNSGITIRDILFNDSYSSAGTHRGIYWDDIIYSHIYHCNFADLTGAAIYLLGDSFNVHILDCEIDLCTWGEGVADAAIDISANTVQNVYMVNIGIYLCGNCGLRMRGTYGLAVNSGFWANGSGASLGNISIESDDNQVQDCYLSESTGPSIFVDGSKGGGLEEAGRIYNTIITGNKISASNNGSGCILKDADRSIVNSNHVNNNDYHGISLDGSYNNIVAGNVVIENGVKTDLTYDNIILDNDSDKNCVQVNLVRQLNIAGPKRTRYGINIANANCDDNMVTNNDLMTSGVTASLNDAGTGTITVAGNRL